MKNRISIKLILIFFLGLTFNFFCIASENDEKKTKDSCCFDVIILGGGSSAISAARELTKNGKDVLMINDGLPLGGTCVNVGCMPSKYLVRAAEAYSNAANPIFPGIIVKKPYLNFKELIKAEKAQIQSLWDHAYSELEIKNDHLVIVKGMARFKNKNIVSVNGKEYSSNKFIIATGGSPKIPNIRGLEEAGYLTNRTLFNLEQKPESITIIGAGYIGLEVASIYAQLGVKVRVLNLHDRILNTQTKDICDELEKYLTKLGVEIFNNCEVTKVEKKGKKNILFCKNRGYKDFELVEKGIIVIATGLEPNTEFIGLGNIGVKFDKEGFIKVNKDMRTTVPNIYAIGDCTNTPIYLYTAVKEGSIAANNILNPGKQLNIDYSTLPWVVFTNPECGGCGIDEEQAKESKVPFKVVTAKVSETSRSSTSMDNRGFIKLLINTQTKKIIGGRIIGANAGEIAYILSLFIKYGIKTTEVNHMFFPYLTNSELLKVALNKYNTSNN